MNIGEMHVWFRQYAQQMGMQNVRAILPEQIDLLINTSITDTINQLIRENIGITNDRIITDNSKIGQINAFRTLYKVANVAGNKLIQDTESSFIQRRSIKLEDIREQVGSKMESISYIFLVDMSISYSRSLEDAGPKKTILYPVRLIDDAFLADTLNDFILRPKFRSPIAVIYNNQLDLYIDEIDDKGALPYNLLPLTLRISYIAKPNIVKYADDVPGVDSIDCNLPESMHVDILKHAVDLYRISVSGALSSSQQQQQAQQQEDARNNYRNEGTQQR